MLQNTDTLSSLIKPKARLMGQETAQRVQARYRVNKPEQRSETGDILETVWSMFSGYPFGSETEY